MTRQMSYDRVSASRSALIGAVDLDDLVAAQAGGGQPRVDDGGALVAHTPSESPAA